MKLKVKPISYLFIKIINFSKFLFGFVRSLCIAKNHLFTVKDFQFSLNFSITHWCKNHIFQANTKRATLNSRHYYTFMKLAAHFKVLQNYLIFYHYKVY